MKKGIVNNALSNKIQWATHNDKGLITGKKQDITEDCIKAVFTHLNTKYIRSKENQERGFCGYKIDGLGELIFKPENS